MTDTTAGEGVRMTDQQMVQSLRDHYNFALKGPWPGIQVPHYALAGLFQMAADRIEALAAQTSAGAQGEEIGCAEPQVGRAVYQRIEKLIDLKPQPNTSEWTELDYLSDLTNCVEEYGSYDGHRATPAQPDTGDVAALREALARMKFLLSEVEEGVPAVCDSPLFASYEFASDFKRVVDFASLAALTKPNAPGAPEDGGA